MKQETRSKFNLKIYLGILGLFLFLSFHSGAQIVVAKWNFEDRDLLVDENNIDNNYRNIWREKTSPGIVYDYPAGNPGFGLSTDSWQSGSGTKYYEIEISTLYTNLHTISFDQNSSNNGPRDFRLEYKIGAGAWTMITNIVLPNSSWKTTSVALPSACDNKAVVYLRWVMTSNNSTTGGSVSSPGTSAIDNIFVSGQLNYSCFTYGYFSYHTCGSVYTFPSSASGGLGSTPQGMPGAPNYGVCWKNINAGDRANWIVIQPTATGTWSFTFSPTTGNVNAWIWGPYNVIPGACDQLTNLLDCNNGTGGNPISIFAPVIAGKYYVTLVANPTGTNSIITLTSSSGEASILPPVVNDTSRCGPGAVTLRASGAEFEEYYEWWNAPVGGTLLKRSADNLDSTFTTPSLSVTTTYYVSILFLHNNQNSYYDSCASRRVPVTVTVNPYAVAPVSVTTNLTNVCFPDPRSVVLTANGGSGDTLKWYTGGCQITQIATGNPLTIPAPVVSTTYFAAWETVCGTSACASVTVTVNAPVTTGAIGADQTICSGGDPVMINSITNGTGSGVISYNWEKFTAPGPWINIPGATSASYDPPAGLTATTFFRRTTISTEAGGICESAPTAPVAVFVNIVTPGSLGVSQVICRGDDPKPFTEISLSTATGTISYQWEESLSATGPWSGITGVTGALYTVPPGIPVTKYFRRIITSTLNGVSCSAISNVLSITVNPKPITSIIFHY